MVVAATLRSLLSHLCLRVAHCRPQVCPEPDMLLLRNGL